MRKLLTFLTTLTAAVAVIVLFTACEQFLKDPEDFLSYWASEAFIKDHSIGAVDRPDGAGVPCVSSSVDLLPIMLTVHNPKGFSFVLPTAVEFKELSEPPTEGTHYVLGRTASDRLKLTYTKDFLQKYEQGSGSLNPTITLKATDGRVFKKTYTFGIKSNTPPPEPKEIVIAKTKIDTLNPDSYYVLCLKFDLAKMIKTVAMNSGTVPLHKDITNITINDSPYTLLYKEDNSDFKTPAGTFPIGSFIEHGNVEKLNPSSPDVPSGAWVLYYKTNIQIGPGNPPTTYRITLIDKGGVTSDEAVATIEANSSTHTVTFKVVDEEGGTLTANSGYNSSTTSTSTVQVPNGTTVTFTATPYSGWELDSWTGVTSSSSLNATLTVDGDATVTVKFKRVITIQNGNSFAWKLLKDAVKVAVDGTTITIKGEIKASVSYEGGWGQIVIKNKSLTIEGKPGADSDILDANGLSRIFKVENGANLILKNLTLTGGKATGIGDAGSGGAIYAKDASTVNIENCIITGNEADTNGGGLNVEGTPTTITNCTFTGNTAKNGGGIYIIGASSYPVVTISGGTIGGTGTNEANKATGTGSDGNGGGIYVGNLCKVILQNNGSTGCTIKGNTAQRGGGVYANNADVIMKGRTRIAVNEVNNDVYLDNNSLINVADPLTAEPPVARITPQTYSEFPPVQVLYSDTSGLVSSEYYKFEVTPESSTAEWVIKSDGCLKKAKGVVSSSSETPWKDLKTVITSALDGDIIVINGKIKATDALDNYGEITINKSITIKGKNKDTAILNANKNGKFPHRIFYVSANKTVTLQNLTLTGGVSNNDGGAIFIAAASSSTTGSKVKMINCIIKNNVAISYGGGVYIGRNGTFTMDGESSRITNNYVSGIGTGFAVYIDGKGTFNWIKGSISNNGGSDKAVHKEPDGEFNNPENYTAY